MVFKNKKAQNITSPFTIVLALSVIALISTIFFDFGADLAGDPNSAITEESRSFIFNHSGFSVEERTAADADDIFYSSETPSEGNLKDYALEFQFYREKSSPLRTTFQDLYDLPTFFLGMLNIPVSESWQTFITIINGVIWMIIFYLIYRIIRGLI